jgi:hypothetical protein
MPKRSWLTSLLLALVLIGAAANLLVFFRYLQVLNTAQRLQLQAQRLQVAAAIAGRNLAVMRNLAAETLEFSQKVPATTGLLQAHSNLLRRLELAPTPAAR